MAVKTNTIAGAHLYTIPSQEPLYGCQAMSEKRYSSDVCFVAQSQTDGTLKYTPMTSSYGNLSGAFANLDNQPSFLPILQGIGNECIAPGNVDYHDCCGNQWHLNGAPNFLNNVTAEGLGPLTFASSTHSLLLAGSVLFLQNVNFGSAGWTLEFFVRWIPNFWSGFVSAGTKKCSVITLHNSSTGKMFCISNPIDFVAQGLVTQADVLAGTAKYPIVYSLRSDGNYSIGYNPNYTYVDASNWHHIALINFPASMISGLPEGATDLVTLSIDGVMIANTTSFGNEFEILVLGGDPFYSGGIIYPNSTSEGASGLMMDEFRVSPGVLYNSLAGFSPPTTLLGMNDSTLYYSMYDFSR